jgi:hypothetical protein
VVHGRRADVPDQRNRRPMGRQRGRPPALVLFVKFAPDSASAGAQRGEGLLAHPRGRGALRDRPEDAHLVVPVPPTSAARPISMQFANRFDRHGPAAGGGVAAEPGRIQVRPASETSNVRTVTHQPAVTSEWSISWNRAPERRTHLVRRGNGLGVWSSHCSISPTSDELITRGIELLERGLDSAKVSNS